jgi:hypothetical protein
LAASAGPQGCIDFLQKGKGGEFHGKEGSCMRTLRKPISWRHRLSELLLK